MKQVLQASKYRSPQTDREQALKKDCCKTNVIRVCPEIFMRTGAGRFETGWGVGIENIARDALATYAIHYLKPTL